MSLQAITGALALRGYAASEKLLLIAWANYADENGRCYPSQRRIAADTGLSDRQIRTIAANLEARGAIQRLERRRPDGSRSTDLITLCCLIQAEVTSGGVRKSLPGGAEVTSGQNLSSNHKVLKEPSLASKRVPESWKPSEEDYAVGTEEGLTAPEIIRETARFRDHTFTPARSDWSATFRNWLRNAADRKPKNDPANPSAKLVHLDRVARAMAAAVERPGDQHSGDSGLSGFEGGSSPRLAIVGGSS